LDNEELADSASDSVPVLGKISGNVNCLEREGKSAVLGGGADNRSAVIAGGG
jgi:hypothetical protein